MEIEKKIREQALTYGDNGLELGDIPPEMRQELERLTTDAMAAKEVKLSASEEAQQARIAFNALIKEKSTRASRCFGNRGKPSHQVAS